MNVQKSLRNSKSGKPPRHRERPASGMRKGEAIARNLLAMSALTEPVLWIVTI